MDVENRPSHGGRPFALNLFGEDTMRPRPDLLAACALILLAGASAADEPKPQSPKGTFWIIPHTHWEGAVFKTRAEYLDMGLANILKAMRLLREQPGFKFTLDQVAYVRPFLERFPAEEADFRRFLAEGRLQLAGALDVMPDDNMPGGETFVRQMIYGKGYYREKLGLDVTTGWQLDTFGHHAQMPQLMTLGGYRSFWFFRGVPRQDFPSEFIWEGIDGTRIDAYWLPHGYAIAYPSPKPLSAFRAATRARFDLLNLNSRGILDRAGPSGADVSEPEEHLVPLVEAFNQGPDRPLTVKVAVPADFEAVTARRTDRTVFKGELNPIFQGIYSSRIELKEWMRTIERKLLIAEKLGVLAAWLGTPSEPSAILAAWEPALFNQTHDLASGVMTDHVYEDTIRSYEYSRRRSDELIDASWNVLTSRIDTRGSGIPIVVFNPLGWTRSDVAEVEVGFGEGGVADVELSGPDGQAVPVQILEATRYADRGIKTARIAFIARDVPALGYATYHAAPGRGPAKGGMPSDALTVEVLLENELYWVVIDRATGALTRVRVKPSGWEVLAGRGNVVLRQQDRGDLWELYRGLDGGSRVAMTTRQPVPKRGEAAFSDEGNGMPGRVRKGPVFSEFQVARTFGLGQFATVVRVYQGLRRIEVTTRLVNGEKYVRYQVLFPTSIKDGKTTHEIPFGAIERPAAIEFPAQNWSDHGDGRHGLALLNIGLPGNLTSDGTMMISLLRSHNLGAYGFGGGYEPGMSSESGFQLGQERTLRYALVPHAGDWREARVFRDGLEFNHPLLCRPVAPHAGNLPARWGLLEISNPNVVLSALKPGRDGTAVLRVYEATGRPAQGVKIAFNARVVEARAANLLEDPEGELKVEDNAVTTDLRPFQIRTIRVRLGG
jgi:alpha-mannosidase